MATYIILVNYTDQGIRDIRDAPNRLDAAKSLAQDLGGEFKHVYLTLGAPAPHPRPRSFSDGSLVSGGTGGGVRPNANYH